MSETGSISVSQCISSPPSSPLVISDKLYPPVEKESSLTSGIGGCGSSQEPLSFAAIQEYSTPHTKLLVNLCSLYTQKKAPWKTIGASFRLQLELKSGSWLNSITHIFRGKHCYITLFPFLGDNLGRRACEKQSDLLQVLRQMAKQEGRRLP